MAQINTVVGDIEGNAQKDYRIGWIARRVSAPISSRFRNWRSPDIRPKISCSNRSSSTPILPLLKEVVAATQRHRGRDRLRRSAGRHLQRGRHCAGRSVGLASYHKMYLPNYGVFDEFRYFQAGKRMLRSSGSAIRRSASASAKTSGIPTGPFFHQASVGRRGSPHQHFLLALSRRKAALARAHAGNAGRGQYRHRCLQQSRRRAGRTRFRWRQHGARRERRHHRPRASNSKKIWWSWISTLNPSSGSGS